MSDLIPLNPDQFGAIKIAGGPGGTLGVPFGQTIFLIDVQVAGTTYVDNVAEIEPELRPGDRVFLFREPKNEFDPLAIVVKDGKNRKLGYIPRRENPVLARLLDAGKRIFGEIKRKELVEKRNVWLKLEVALYLDD